MRPLFRVRARPCPVRPDVSVARHIHFEYSQLLNRHHCALTHSTILSIRARPAHALNTLTNLAQHVLLRTCCSAATAAPKLTSQPHANYIHNHCVSNPSILITITQAFRAADPALLHHLLLHSMRPSPTALNFPLTFRHRFYSSRTAEATDYVRLISAHPPVVIHWMAIGNLNFIISPSALPPPVTTFITLAPM